MLLYYISILHGRVLQNILVGLLGLGGISQGRGVLVTEDQSLSRSHIVWIRMS